MRKLLYILTVLLLGLSDVEAQQVDKAAVKAKVNRTAMEMKSLECDFIQTKHLKMLSDKMVSKGRMWYQQKNKLRWEYTSPQKYVFVLNTTKVRIETGGRNDVIDTNQNKVFKEIARIMMNSVVGKCLNDDKEYKVDISTSGSDWMATLTPQRKNMKQFFKKIIIHFDQRRALVNRVELLEKNDDRTVIELKNVKTNHAISPSLFAVD
jgi:outer membrane lipoprotein carrier protein